MRDVWNALGEGDYADILRLLILTGARREEIAALRWSEIDLARGVIALPGERTKNHRAFDIPLSSPALAILQKRRRVEGCDNVFGRTSRGFSGFSECKSALDERLAELRMREGRPPMPAWVVRDLRRTMSTMMHEALGIPPHVVEACINHVSGHQGGVAGIHNKSTYAREKRAAFDKSLNSRGVISNV